MSAVPRILIVTAAFGEGHNSAARNLALAFNNQQVVTRVSDPCLLGVPRLTLLVNRAYRYITTHLPKLWGKIYRSTDRCDLSRQRSWPMRAVERALADLIEEFQPTAVVSTYPLYPYFLTRIFEKSGKPLPVFIIVTDSIEINSAWLRAQGGCWFVTDGYTRQVMIDAGSLAEKVIETGFPVHPSFSSLVPVNEEDACDPFRVLYFPTTKLPFIRRHARALLGASSQVHLTFVLGRNVRQLYPRAHEIQKAYPGRVRIIGWTRRVPELLNRHHLVVGKAGGATVHEAIAARCPMLIHHLVPGQEEGNLRLLEAIGAGQLADSPEALARATERLLANHAETWRVMKRALSRHDRNSGGTAAARLILQHLGHI